MSARPSACHSAETVNQSMPLEATRTLGTARRAWKSPLAPVSAYHRTPCGRASHASASDSSTCGVSRSHQPLGAPSGTRAPRRRLPERSPCGSASIHSTTGATCSGSGSSNHARSAGPPSPSVAATTVSANACSPSVTSAAAGDSSAGAASPGSVAAVSASGDEGRTGSVASTTLSPGITVSSGSTRIQPSAGRYSNTAPSGVTAPGCQFDAREAANTRTRSQSSAESSKQPTTSTSCTRVSRRSADRTTGNERDSFSSTAPSFRRNASPPSWSSFTTSRGGSSTMRTNRPAESATCVRPPEASPSGESSTASVNGRVVPSFHSNDSSSRGASPLVSQTGTTRTSSGWRLARAPGSTPARSANAAGSDGLHVKCGDSGTRSSSACMRSLDISMRVPPGMCGTANSAAVSARRSRASGGASSIGWRFNSPASCSSCRHVRGASSSPAPVARASSVSSAPSGPGSRCSTARRRRGSA